MTDQTSRDISRVAAFLAYAEAENAPIYGNISATEALDALCRAIGKPPAEVRATFAEDSPPAAGPPARFIRMGGSTS